MRKLLTAGAALLVLGLATAAYAADDMDKGNAMQDDMQDSMSKTDGMATDKDAMGKSDESGMKADAPDDKAGMESDMPAHDKDKM